MTTSTKHPKVRRVFGRLTLIVNGTQFRAEMRRDGLWIRPKHSRNPVCMAWAALWAASQAKADVEAQERNRIALEALRLERERLQPSLPLTGI